MGTAKRPGRPWAEARGTSREINDLVHVLRSWLDTSNVPVAKLHRLLTPEHFGSGSVPPVWRLREQLNGVGLAWELAEAVADVCFPDETGQQTAERLDRIRPLWTAANEAPTPSRSAYDLVEAQQRTIAALEELNRVRQAFEVSEQARLQALQVSTLLFALLGQTQAHVARLSRQLDVLRTSTASAPGDVRTAASRLDRAQQQTEDLRTQLARAEGERDRAQQVADHAARQISRLEEELRDLRADAGAPGPSRDEAGIQLPDPEGVTAGDAALDQVDAVLQRARDVLDREHEAVEGAAEDVGLGEAPIGGAGDGGTIIPGQAVRRDAGVPDPGDEELFRTTPHNSSVLWPTGILDPSVDGVDQELITIMRGLRQLPVPDFSNEILLHLRDQPQAYRPAWDPLVLRFRGTLRTDLRGHQTIFLPGAEPAPAAERCEVGSSGALADVLCDGWPVFCDTSATRTALVELVGPGRPLPDGPRQVIIAPLHSRSRVMGAAVLVRHPARPPFLAKDLHVAAWLATHTMQVMDDTAQRARDSDTSTELQRRMLPASLPQQTGVRLAARYLPAQEPARRGGDWYDAIALPGSRVALIVGDVMGNSMPSAAAVMGQLRGIAQTLAGFDLPPRDILERLDGQARGLGELMATCLCVVYDPVSHRITLSNAGHPPPVLLHLGGRAEVLRVPPGAPIGVGGVDFEEVELDAPPGSTLLLYTDGLVESRLRDVWTGIEQLRERLATTAQLTGLEHPPAPEALCDDVLDMLGPGDRDDDIALLAARFDGIAPGDFAYWFLDPEETAPGRARRFARRALTRWGLEELSDSLELLVSEVVTNAVRYAERPVTLRLLRTDVLRCEVGDDFPQLPRLHRARATDEGGRGVFLVDRIARRWGAVSRYGGKLVWFELDLPDAPGRPQGDPEPSSPGP
ncbi:SpoIIE family protein phosphatase [Streptomyces sp. NPDC059989]|uniref:SpoIIE family protein phosphatase n=1 Tax=Streptomyces sp. NPDC059989 TaxID=3347026 RepID=UPI0036C4F565